MYITRSQGLMVHLSYLRSDQRGTAKEAERGSVIGPLSASLSLSLPLWASSSLCLIGPLLAASSLPSCGFQGVKTSHKKDGRHRRPLIFHVSWPPPSDHPGSNTAAPLGVSLCLIGTPSASLGLICPLLRQRGIGQKCPMRQRGLIWASLCLIGHLSASSFGPLLASTTLCLIWPLLGLFASLGLNHSLPHWAPLCLFWPPRVSCHVTSLS